VSPLSSAMADMFNTSGKTNLGFHVPVSIMQFLPIRCAFDLDDINIDNTARSLSLFLPSVLRAR
jgi:hypothetical protein